MYESEDPAETRELDARDDSVGSDDSGDDSSTIGGGASGRFVCTLVASRKPAAADMTTGARRSTLEVRSSLALGSLGDCFASGGASPGSSRRSERRGMR